MKSKIFFFGGILTTLTIFSLWQGESLGQIVFSLNSYNNLLSPKIISIANPPQVLGELTTLENNFDYGEVGPEEGVVAQGAFAYDLTDNRMVFEKDSRKRLQAASTVKIVTAAVALSKAKLEEEITVNYFPTKVGESSMNLLFGEKFTLEELLYGLLLVSGNDAAETIAQGVAGNRLTYITWMNDFAKKAGAKETNFTTASGLDEDGQYTTAYDLYLMGKYVFSNYPLVGEISITKEKSLPETSGHRAYLLKNKLLILDSFSLVGVKPGLGEEGMLSLITLVRQKEKNILVSIIRTPSIRHDLEQILKQI